MQMPDRYAPVRALLGTEPYRRTRRTTGYAGGSLFISNEPIKKFIKIHVFLINKALSDLDDQLFTEMIKSAYLGSTVFTVVRHKDGENRTFDAQCKIDMAVYIGACDIDAAVDMGIARGIGLNVRESLSHLEWIC